VGAVARLLAVMAAAVVAGGIIGGLIGWSLGSVGGRFHQEDVWPASTFIGASLGPAVAIAIMLRRRGRTG
jgi:hypothetical protein